jgi:hypothetical protein
MPFNKNSGYGQMIADAGVFAPKYPEGNSYFVGAATLQRVQRVAEIFGIDPNGVTRYYTTLAACIAAIAALHPNVTQLLTVATSGNLFTTPLAHGFSVGDKVYLTGTTAPTNYTLGTVYYVIAATTTTFQLSLQRGGTVITVGSTGTAVSVIPVKSIGETIYIMPGHVETVASATALNINVAGLTIIGLGSDEDRPTYYLNTATTAVITISAPCVTIQNIMVDGTGFAAIVTMFNVTASDVSILGNKFVHANSTNQAGLVITSSALANRMKILGNYFVGSANAGTTNVLQIVGGNDIQIRNNIFIGNYTTSLGAINNVTTACLNLVIDNNFIENNTASSTKAIVLVSTSTGVIANNRMQILSGTAPITGAAMSWAGGNYYAATIATAGTLI